MNRMLRTLALALALGSTAALAQTPVPGALPPGVFAGERDIALAEMVGSPVHIAHLSTRQALRAVWASGVAVIGWPSGRRMANSSISTPEASSTARCMAFSSSRTLPLQR